MTPESRQEGLDSMSGEYVGIGATVMRRDEGDYVFVDIIPGSPAEEAGLQSGDVIVSVDGIDANTFEDVNQLAIRVRGEEGTTVTLVLIRALSQEKESIDVVRRPITNASVRQKMIADGIGYVQVTEFSTHASENFERAVMELLDEGAQHLVIDLRDNGGGYANECVNMLDVLLPPQDVVTVRGREDGEDYEEKWSTTTAALVPDSMTYVILLNEYSASASELFSGVLRDLGKATLVGEQTFGKGVGTLTWDLEDKSAIQITTFEYFLPKGESINEIGLVPDYEVSLSPEAETKAISLLTLEEDTQLQKALEILEPRVE
jgi:carboxyl-terminal processing protease